MGISGIAPEVPIYFYSLAIFKANDEDARGLPPAIFSPHYITFGKE